MTAAGARLGVGDPCPSCGSKAGSTPSDLGHACAVCGCPRILVDPAVPREGREGPLLVEAKKVAEGRVGWGVAGAVGAVGTALAGVGVGFLALITDFGMAGQGVLGLAVLAPLALSAFGFLRVRRAGTEVARRLDDAAVVVTTELARAEGGHVDARNLAQRLHVPVDRAEELVARAQVEGLLDADAPVPRLRVDAATDDIGDELGQETAETRRRHES